MFQSILVILFILKFILKLVKRFEFYAPRFIQNHYGTEAKVDIKKLERLVCKIEKWKADIKFLRFCLIFSFVLSSPNASCISLQDNL